MSRREGRELALQILFQIDVGKADPLQCIADLSSGCYDHYTNESKQFATNLIEGVIGNLEQIDKTIGQHSIDWSLHRMANVDRNVLRIAVYEICFYSQTPYKVAINEALELVKKYSNPESGKFINGVLGNVAKNVLETLDRG